MHRRRILLRACKVFALSVALACTAPAQPIPDAPTLTATVPTATSPPASRTPAAAPPPATPSPRPAPTAPAAHDPTRWHPPTDHEHGDPPPFWIAAAGYELRYDGPFSTGPHENTHKHAGHKGFAARFDDVDLYFRVHASSVPMDRAGRYHSYEVFARDPSGAVSHWQGWYAVGDPDDERHPTRRGNPGDRALIRVVDEASWRKGDEDRCEWWYPEAPSWSWTWSWRICDAETLWHPDETTASPAHPTGGTGLLRRLKASWLAEAPPRGRFWSTVHGEIVPGPTAPRCAPAPCLEQVIQPTMPRVRSPGNVAERQFPAPRIR